MSLSDAGLLECHTYHGLLSAGGEFARHTGAVLLQTKVDFSQPFIAEAIHDELRAGRELVFDLDLMGQSVSSTRRTWPDIACGSLRSDGSPGSPLARWVSASP